jgi:hypothetical protein
MIMMIIIMMITIMIMIMTMKQMMLTKVMMLAGDMVKNQGEGDHGVAEISAAFEGEKALQGQNIREVGELTAGPCVHK